MAPPRGAASSSSTSAIFSTTYSLSLLAEYAHTLDSLPLDLSRNFADLRELDAVLSSSVQSITKKIHNLTEMIEQGTASKEERLWLLTEIAEEASRLKLGGEDKIRVACQGADNLKAHSTHLRTLAEHIPGFDPVTLNRKTVYPHVSARSFMPAASLESGRRRRGAYGSIMVASNNADPSPAKRKRTKEDDIDVGTARTPKKDRTDGTARPRNNTRRRTERVASPSESLVSVTSHLPTQQTQTNNRGGSNAANTRTTNGQSNSTNKRSRANNNNNHNHNGIPSHANRNPTPLNDQYITPHDTLSHASASARRDYNNVPASSAHPSLPLAYQNGAVNGHVQNGYDPLSHALGAPDWTPLLAQQLEGPGMPVARGTSIHSTVASVPVVTPGGVNDAATEAGDAEGDADDRTYCFCDGVSFGQMIACDDNNCEREWFHITCIGLTTPPSGRWFCEACRQKRNAKRAGRGGRRRAGGNRAGAKGA